MMKHAFLILAHDNPKVLSFLLKQLDAERNDVYIHLDLKSMLNSDSFETKKSDLIFIKRTKCFWGDYSQTNATLRLLEEAHKKGGYKYYHLLGGTSLCVKSQDEIHTFYDDTNLEYFHINVGTFKSIQNRCKYFYPFINTSIFRSSKILKGLSIILGRIQIILGINRLRKSNLSPIYGGMEWFSITEDFVDYILRNEKIIKKTFKYTLASEEVFIQTLAMHSSFRDRVYGYNGKDDFIDASKTYQFWNNGKSTYIDTVEKINIIKNDSHSFFARKFRDEDIDIINQCLGDTIRNEE